ncbi:MAG: bifunctional alpha/beta hydrolase/class I SAM-dependent methyltransferase, partial [Telluria sp.]
MTLPVRSLSESTFAGADGTPLFYRHWSAAGVRAKKAVVLFHRGHEHGGRMAHLVEELAMPDAAFFAWDARGLGRSPGERGYAEHIGTLVKDVDCFIRHISRHYGIAIEDIAIVAQSVGAVLVSAWVHDYAPAIRCMVLASPAFKVKLYVPLARPALALMLKLRKKMFVNSYVKAKFLTHDPERIASYGSDPLITRPIAVNILLGLYEAGERVVGDAATITVPTQLLVSGDDWVVQHAPQHAFFERLGSPVKESHVLDGYLHDTFGELDRERALDLARTFLRRCFDAPPGQVDLLQADRSGVTKTEFDRLSAPPTSLLASAWWALSRLSIKAGGALSGGMKLGMRTGFDSGSTLDYVYRNQAQGVPVLGPIVDRIFLDSIGWRGIRQRKVHLARLINSAIDRLASERLAVNVVDIAAGHGRYLLEAIAPRKAQVERIVLRDYSELNVAGGQALIKELGMETIARFVQADAFDRRSLAALTPAPTLAVVSGLYELFPDNSLLRASLGGLADAMLDGGYLVYTNQPWHPQLELIARS